MSNLNNHIKSDKAKWVIMGIVLVLILAILGGVVAAIVTETNPKEWLDDIPVSSVGAKEYTPIEVGDIVTRLYFNRDFDFVSFFEERFPDGMTDERSYLEIKTGDISLIVAYMPIVESDDKPAVAILEEHQAAPLYVSEKVVIPNGNEDGRAAPLYVSEKVVIPNGNEDGSDVVWEPGWSIDEDYIDFAGFDNNFRITEIRGQNLFKYFISTDGVFAEL